MPQWVSYLFVYFLVTIPVILGLMLVALLTRSTAVKRAAEVVLLTGVAALLPVVLHRALEKPTLWLVVAFLAASLIGGVVMHVRSYGRSA